MMLGGGGVDGAIHRAAGSRLLEECRLVPQVKPGVRCPPGEARITAGHRLAARHVIHTVGPVWQGGDDGEDQTLASCYAACLNIAVERGFASIAFPAISTGVYGFPVERAAEIAVREAREHARRATSLERIVFANFDERTQGVYRRLLGET
jgi:O-acetyl-ADP-ribose deacetylase (regulator of RNase III)